MGQQQEKPQPKVENATDLGSSLSGKRSMALRTLFIGMCFLGTLTMLTGCPKNPPTEAFNQAKDAIQKALNSLAAQCAKDELNAATNMMAKAKKLMDEGKYDDAKIAFDTAKKLAEKAQEEAQLNKKNCLKDRNPPPVNTTPGPPTVVAGREIPISDTRGSLTTIYFGFNQYNLTEDTKRILVKHAEWLNKRPGILVEVSGHCDQRGSVEYNLALGERRALAVKQFLINLGVSTSRISIISFGHQKPADPAFNAEAFAKNRRAEFRVSQKQ